MCRRLVCAVALTLGPLGLPAQSLAGPPGSLSSLPAPFGCIRDLAPPPLIGDPLPGCTLGRGLGQTGPVALSPDGTSVYMVAFDTRPRHQGGIAIFRREAGTGALEQLPGAAGCLSEAAVSGCAGARGLRHPADAAVSADGHNVYVASTGSSAVAAFARDPEGGALTQLPGASGCVGEGGGDGCARARGIGGARQLALSSDGRSVYVGSARSLAVLTRDPSTGALAQLPGRFGCLHKDGRDGCAAYPLLRTAEATVSPDGLNVYVSSYFDDGITTFGRNQENGALRRPRGRAYCFARSDRGCDRRQAIFAPSGLVVSPDGRNAYVTSVSGAFASQLGGLTIFARDPASGRLRALPGRRGCITGEGGRRCTKGRSFSGDELWSPVASPDGRNIYVYSGQDVETRSVVVAFERRAIDGSLQQLAGKAGCWGNDSRCTRGVIPEEFHAGLAMAPDGVNVYVFHRSAYYGTGEPESVIVTALARSP